MSCPSFWIALRQLTCLGAAKPPLRKLLWRSQTNFTANSRRPDGRLYMEAHSFCCSPFPSRSRFAGLRLGFPRNPRLCLCPNTFTKNMVSTMSLFLDCLSAAKMFGDGKAAVILKACSSRRIFSARSFAPLRTTGSIRKVPDGCPGLFAINPAGPPPHRLHWCRWGRS